MKNPFRKTGKFFILLLVLIIHSCQKEKPIPPVLTTTAVSAISYTTATSGGIVTNEGGSPVISRGVCWNTSLDPTTANSKTTDGTGTGSFSSSLTGLIAGTTYYVRAYATNISGTGYGNHITVTTLQTAAPVLTTTAITTITQTSAVSGGNITVDNGATITARGVCWGTVANPTTANNKTTDATGTGIFTSTLTGLIGNTTYYVRAYATNSVGTSYGNQVSFITSPLMPTLSTTATTSITQTSATSGGNVTSDGGATVTARGVCWSTASGPTTSLSTKTTETGTTGNFTSSISGLSIGTTYYLRAYATNSAGTAYGNEISFTTNTSTVPIITTTAATSITGTTATSGGNVTSDGGAIVTARGVCWSTSANPTTALSTKTTDAGTTGPFTSSITGLTIGTVYYVRAYATNSVGTAYGTQDSFTTNNVPTLTTTAATSITGTAATSGGNVTSDGGATVTARGVCWSTSANPTTALSTKTSETGTTGTFISTITGLTVGTTYYIRAYATNSVGTSYGTQVTFTTTNVPTIITSVISLITITSSKSGGNVTSDGGATVTARGVCWSTSANPTTALSTKTSETGTTGIFISSITGLAEGTTYYVRAYATNNVGTVYGSEISFKTPSTGTVTDIDGNINKTITIGNQTWMAENLKVVKFNDGTVIPNITDQASWWNGITTPVYSWYNNDASYKNVYGALYTWYVVDPISNGGKNVCPTGWHVATDAEWTVLSQYLVNNGFGYDGPIWGSRTDWISKSLSLNSGWTISGSLQGACPGWNQEDNNSSGFTALPSGIRDQNGFSGFGSLAKWWCAPGSDTGSAWFREIATYLPQVNRSTSLKGIGYSIRCLKD